MKKIYLFSIFLLLISLGCVSKNNSGGTGINVCNYEMILLRNLITQCPDAETYTMPENLKEGSCKLFKADGVLTENEQEDPYYSCIDTLESMACDALLSIKTIEDFQAINGCLDLKKRTKKDLCVINQSRYCASLYNNCGRESLSEICENSFGYEKDETDVVRFNESKLAVFCEDTIDGDEEITTLDEFFCSYMGAPDLECNNIPDLDFRNNSWKSYCSGE